MNRPAASKSAFLRRRRSIAASPIIGQIWRSVQIVSIEPAIVELAAREATEKDFAAMNALLALARAMAPISECDPTDEEIICLALTAARLNVALGRATQNATMAEIMNPLSRAMDPVRHLAVRESPREALSPLEATLDAVTRRDVELIRRTLTVRFDHVEEVRERTSKRRLRAPRSLQDSRSLDRSLSAGKSVRRAGLRTMPEDDMHLRVVSPQLQRGAREPRGRRYKTSRPPDRERG
jgi:hypothetical protein